MTFTRHRGHVCMALVLAFFTHVAVAFAQPPVIPTTANLYGVHASTVFHAPPPLTPPYINPFRDLVLTANFTAPSGRVHPYKGFYDGDGAGGMVGTYWRIRFMPDEVTAPGQAWTLNWSFSDGSASGTHYFSVTDIGLRGPARQTANGRLLQDARDQPIDWRGYGLKHLGKTVCCDPPLSPTAGTNLITLAVDGHLVPKGYNAAYIMVPTGYQHAGRTPTFPPHTPAHSPQQAHCIPTTTQDDCPLWGDYLVYSLRASQVFDQIIQGLHGRNIWAVSWITFMIQPDNAGAIWRKEPGYNRRNYEYLMDYFQARYGAYSNFFMWSPTWEVWELPNQPDPSRPPTFVATYVDQIKDMMTYLVSIDPGHKNLAGVISKRLQGVHDLARVEWHGAPPTYSAGAWQTILPRQQSSRTSFGSIAPTGQNANTRVTGAPGDYPYVIIGAEDLWEFCNGDVAYSKPTNAAQVRRGLLGGLFASVLPIYDEMFEGPYTSQGGPPCNGLGAGSGHPYVKKILDWWYGIGQVRLPSQPALYREPGFTMLNGAGCTAGTGTVAPGGQVCSGVPGQRYVLFRETAGNVSINLTGYPGTYEVYAYNIADPEAVIAGGYVTTLTGNAVLTAPAPYAETLVYIRKQ